MITYITQETVSHVLTPEGAQIALQGSHEARVWAAVPVKGQGTPITPKQLEQQVGSETAKIGQGRAFKNKWIGKEGDGLVKLVGFRSQNLNKLNRNRNYYRRHPYKMLHNWRCEKWIPQERSKLERKLLRNSESAN